MRKKALIAASVLLILNVSLDANAASKKKKEKKDIIELPQWEVIEEIVNEGGQLKHTEIISPPSAEAYALLLLKGEGEEVALQEEGSLEEEVDAMKPWEKALYTGVVGLVAGVSVGWAGGAIGARSIKGERDRAFTASLVGMSIGTSLGTIPAVHYSGKYIFKDKDSFWGCLIGGVAGVLAGAAISYPFKDFSVPTFTIPILGAAGSVLGSKYIFSSP